LGEHDVFLDRILNANPSRKSVYFERGTYLVRLDDLLFDTNRGGEMNSIWEQTVLCSNNVDIPPGTSVGYLQKMSRDSAPGNIKMNIAGVLGVDSGVLTGEAGKKAFSRAYSDEKDGKSPLSGVLAKVIVAMRTSKDRSFTYLFATYERFGEQDEGSIPSQEAWRNKFGVATTVQQSGAQTTEEGSKSEKTTTSDDDNPVFL